MFETPPQWTVPIANLTDWFDWTAIAALGTIATLAIAIALATRDSRERRSAKAAIIMAAIQPLTTAIQTIDQQWALGRELGQAPELVFGRLIKISVLDEMRVSMFEIKPSELPTARAIDAFIAARAAMKNIKEEGQELAARDAQLLIEWVPTRVEDLMRYHETLIQEALKFTTKRKLTAELASDPK
ncbi:hypothetical protein [Brevundimonas sp.]